METVLYWVILTFTAAAIVSELITIVAPDQLIELLNFKPEEIVQKKFIIVLSLLSITYIIDIILLFFCGDPVFRIYALILLGLSILIWFVKSRIKNIKYLLIIESTLCLIILIDVFRTVAARYLGIAG